MSEILSVAERNEVIQDVIDRMLYLPDNKRGEFLLHLNILLSLYYVKVREVGGVRVYEPKPTTI